MISALLVGRVWGIRRVQVVKVVGVWRIDVMLVRAKVGEGVVGWVIIRWVLLIGKRRE